MRIWLYPPGADLASLGVQSDVLAFAAMAHVRDNDLSGQPVFLHALRVALALRRDWPKANDAVTLAVMHDSCESGIAEPDEKHYGLVIPEGEQSWIRLAFAHDGGRMMESLRLLTKPEAMPYASYIARVAGDPLAALVKWYDVSDNLGRMRGLKPEDRARFRKKYLPARDHLAAVLRIFHKQGRLYPIIREAGATPW